MAELLQFLVSGLTVGAVYALVALGFTIIYNASDVVNFAQGEFVMLGGMITFFAHQAGPFWTGGSIWTTKRGLERRSLELKELREVKIPANEEAIGRAAAYGDLSENAEWEQAIEQQRQLTEQAKAIEIELSKAALLETPTIPEDTVCPGTEVRYREVATGAEKTLVLLGPWDTGTSERVISYRAPLAAGMLGLHTGDRAEIQLPGGKVEVEILAVEPTKLT